jgi:hypothetical protein
VFSTLSHNSLNKGVKSLLNKSTEVFFEGSLIRDRGGLWLGGCNTLTWSNMQSHRYGLLKGWSFWEVLLYYKIVELSALFVMHNMQTVLHSISQVKSSEYSCLILVRIRICNSYHLTRTTALTLVRSQFSIALNIHIVAFWVMTPCSPVGVYKYTISILKVEDGCILDIH